MHIQLESGETNIIESYTDNQIQVNSIVYRKSVILSNQEIISDFEIYNIDSIDEVFLSKILELKPEIVLIGHAQTHKFLSPRIISSLSQQRVGIECMSIGAACRTYNVLLSEHRLVVAVIILN